MPRPQDLLREFAGLDRRRRAEGVTPLEYQRWCELGRELERAFPDRPPRLGRRGATRMRVEFASRDRLAKAVMENLRPLGLFIPTPFAAEAGVKLELRLRIRDTGEELTGRVEVVSNNVGPDFSTASLGMGVRFLDPTCELRALLEAMASPTGLEEGGPAHNPA